MGAVSWSPVCNDFSGCVNFSESDNANWKTDNGKYYKPQKSVKGRCKKTGTGNVETGSYS